jgi:FlaA1/EpsC-like NDP-sugar epimerase
MMNELDLIGRDKELLKDDILSLEKSLSQKVMNSSFLILGGAGTIGKAVTKEVFKRCPVKLHVVDISENNLVELVRDIRSEFGYIEGDFRTFALDIASKEYDALIAYDGHYDYVLNLSALKHVRSEKDPFTLMRMIDVNIKNTLKTIEQSTKCGVSKYFCVSTDKAANPVNMMGASKRIMEMFLFKESNNIKISTARFANVAFSDGSLLHSFKQRFERRQPIVAPDDVRRYFVTPKESGEICLISAIFGENREIYFPKLVEELNLISLSDIAIKYIRGKGYEPVICESEDQARQLMDTLPDNKKWPCYFSSSNTTGEKPYEEFFTESEFVDSDRYKGLGVIKNGLSNNSDKLDDFLGEINKMRTSLIWNKEDLVQLFNDVIPGFNHVETGVFLDSKM